VTLLAIIGPPGDRQALVQLPSRQSVVLRQGEMLLGWRVAEIGPDALTLGRGDLRLLLSFAN
jgi:hypothetical protein